jgi:sugar lactone lactonase YvrE
MKTKFHIVLISISISLTLAACGGVTPAPASTAQPPTSAPMPTSEAPGLVGTFTNSGEELTFNEDGTWFIRRQNNGSFTVSGKQVTLIDEDNKSDSCPPSQEPGVYEWTLEAQTLTFILVNDSCTTGRIEFFTTGKWQFQSSESLASPVEFVSLITSGPDPLHWPSGMTLDAQGNLYVADTMNHRIQKFDRDGQLLATLGSEGSGDGQFNFVLGDPNHNLPGAGLAVDAQCNLYVTDMGNTRIQKFDSNGNFLLKWGSSGREEGQFVRPFDLTVDAQGNVYVIDDRITGVGPIQKFDSSGNFLARFGEGLIADPGLITVDGQGNLYVPDVAYGTILKLDHNGILLATWGSNGSSKGQFQEPLGVEVDGEGNIYVVDSFNHRIQKLDRNGNFLFEWGIRGSEDGQFIEPYGIRVDSQGNIYVSDRVNNRIQKFRLAKN